MGDSNSIPIVFLAFANDHDDTIGYLRNLREEMRQIREALRSAERQGLCKVVVQPDCTADDIFSVFQDPQYRDRISVFHFGGHANGYELLLESTAGVSQAADANAMADFIGQQNGLQLVFLNGCSTEQQTKKLLDANVACVISTSRSIDDKVATEFADRFYEGIAGGASIHTAFHEASAASRSSKSGNTRSLYAKSKGKSSVSIDEDRWPWNLYLRPGAEEADRWNLPSAANDPLFGMPEVRQSDLPESPYRHLNWFQREDAEVFFGRGHQIRELYDRLTSPGSPPIMLFYGQSGVGKSSILDAGLIPRLESQRLIRYLRLDDSGLLATLQMALDPESEFTSLRSAWKALEEDRGQPLIVFLDQVEEIFTRHDGIGDSQAQEFFEAIESVFAEPLNRPQGKIVLGFRKEWLAELESELIERGLPRSRIFLEPLDRAGIMEVVFGPTKTQRLRNKYSLEIDDALPEMIADDLLDDEGSAIAPTLQILLTKMWQEASRLDYDNPEFTVQLYREMKRKGILLRDFLNQQIESFRSADQVTVDSGLLLDLVALHTTPLGTSDQQSLYHLMQLYGHIGPRLETVLQICEDLRLLTISQTEDQRTDKTSRLAHDTLAPLVREMFDQSDLPGQRARRVLDHRTAESEGELDAEPLGRADLEIVEEGLSGTRDLSEREKQLLEVSRRLRESNQRKKLALVIMGLCAVALILCTAVVATLQWKEATRQTEVANQEKIKANIAFQDAMEAGQQAQLSEKRVRRQLAEAYIHRGARSCESGEMMRGVSTLSLGYDLLESGDPLSESVRRLISGWSLEIVTPLVYRVVDFAVGRESSIAVFANDDNTAQLWDCATGQSIGPPMVHSAEILGVGITNDGNHAFTATSDRTVRIWDTQSAELIGTPLLHPFFLSGAEFSADGSTLVVASGPNVHVWDTENGQSIGRPLTHDATVVGLAIDRNANSLLSISNDPITTQSVATLWDLDARSRKVLDSKMASQLSNKLTGMSDVLMSEDASTAVIAFDGTTAEIWDLKTGMRVGEPVEHIKLVQGRRIALSADGSTLLTVTSDEQAIGSVLQLWDGATGERSGDPLLDADQITCAELSEDGTRLITGGATRGARLWDFQSVPPTQLEMPHAEALSKVVLANGGEIVVTASFDSAIRVWDSTDGLPHTREAPSGFETLVLNQTPAQIQIDDVGSRMLLNSSTDDDQQTVTIWDMQQRRQIGDPLRHGGFISASDISGDGSVVATGGFDRAVRIWDAETGSQIGLPITHPLEGIVVVDLSDDGSRLVTVSGDAGETRSEARLWDTKTGRQIGDALRHDDLVLFAAISGDGSTAITVGSDASARLWDAQSGKLIGKPLVHAGDVDVIGAAISHDGSKVITAASDQSARIWDSRSGQMIGLPIPHKVALNDAEISDDGTIVITGGASTRIWDAQTGKQICDPITRLTQVSAVLISADGRTAVTAGFNDAGTGVLDAQSGYQIGVPLLGDGIVAMTADGKTVFSASQQNRELYVHHVQPPAIDEPERLKLSVEVRTGQSWNGERVLQRLTQTQWLDRKENLNELGGPCDVGSPSRQSAGTLRIGELTIRQLANREPAPPAPAIEESPLEPAKRNWTERSTGKTVTATFIRLERDELILRLPTGDEVAVSPSRLSDEDQAVAGRLERERRRNGDDAGDAE